MKCDGTEEIYVLNKEKAYDFLEKKVEKLQECLSKRLGEKLLEVETSYMIKEK